jgi:hypothetical protein
MEKGKDKMIYLRKRLISLLNLYMNRKDVILIHLCIIFALLAAIMYTKYSVYLAISIYRMERRGWTITYNESIVQNRPGEFRYRYIPFVNMLVKINAIDVSSHQMDDEDINLLNSFSTVDAIGLHINTFPNIGKSNKFCLNINEFDIGKFNDQIDKLYVRNIDFLNLNQIKRISFFEVNLDDRVIEGIKQLSGIESICLDRTNIKQKKLQFLSKLVTLREIEIQDNSITDSDLIYLKDLLNVRKLNLCSSNLNGSFMKIFTKMNKIEILELAFTQIDDSNLRYIKLLASLKTLNIVGTKVGKQGVEEILNNSNVHTINLRYCRRIKENDLKILRKKYSDREILE